MEPFRIIPTRRWLRSSGKPQDVNEKGDQLGVLGSKPKTASPHPDPSTLAKEMEEFEKLMQLGTAEEVTSESASTKKIEKAPETANNEVYAPEQPTTSSLEPYEPGQPTASPTVLSRQTRQSAEAYEPDQPTAGDDVYTPDEPTLPVDENAERSKISEPYEPEQPTDEPMITEESDVSPKAKVEISEVEADMPQLMLDSGGQGEKGADPPPAENTSKSEGGNKSEQENLPEVWLRKKEKKKKHGKHKKPLVEWRLGVLRKDYVIKDFKSFPVDEKLMATTKHKWNDDSEVEHLKHLQQADGSVTDASEISDMTSPAITRSDTDLESEQNTSGEIGSTEQTVEQNAHEGSVIDSETQQSGTNQQEGPKGRESTELEEEAKEIVAKKDLDSVSKLQGTQPGEENDEVKSEKVEHQKEGDKSGQKDNKEVKKSKSEKEDESSTSRVATRRSSRRARRESGDDKSDSKQKSEKKEEDTGRRRSRRHRDDSDDEKKKEADKKAESDRSRGDSRRRSQRRDRYRDDSDDERREGRRSGRSGSRERRQRSTSKERRRHRDDDENRYDRFGRDRRQRRRSIERGDDRRSREDDRRSERTDSRDREDKRRSSRSEKDASTAQSKEDKQSKDEKKIEKSEEKDDTGLQEKKKGDSIPKEDGNVKEEKDQNSKPNSSNKAPVRVPIKFNFTSRAVRRSTRNAIKAKGGVFEDEGDEDEKPLSELKNTCDEQEPQTLIVTPSEDSTPRITRSKSREGGLIAQPPEEKTSQPSSIQVKENTATTSSSDPEKENLSELTLRKDFKKDQESESDSGAELSLMGLGETPTLYPENMLDSQVEMELLASAFSSTDTEAELEIEKVFDKTRKNDNIMKDDMDVEVTPKRGDSTTKMEETDAYSHVENDALDPGDNSKNLELESPKPVDTIACVESDMVQIEEAGVGFDDETPKPEDAVANHEKGTLKPEDFVANMEHDTLKPEKNNEIKLEENDTPEPEELTSIVENDTPKTGDLTLEMENYTPNVEELPVNVGNEVQKFNETTLEPREETSSELTEEVQKQEELISKQECQINQEEVLVVPSITEVDMEIEEQVDDASLTKDSSPVHRPNEFDVNPLHIQDELETNVKTDSFEAVNLPDGNRMNSEEEVLVTPSEQSNGEAVDTKESSTEIREADGNELNELVLPEIKIVPPPEEPIKEMRNLIPEGQKEETTTVPTASLETEKSNVETMSPIKKMAILESESDLSKTESESEDGMEVIDLMAGTAYTTSEISVVMPKEDSAVDTVIQEVPESIADKDNKADCETITSVEEGVPSEPQSAQNLGAVPPVPDLEAETVSFDQSTSDQNEPVQEEDEANLSTEMSCSDTDCVDEMPMPSIEIENEYLPSQKDTTEVLSTSPIPEEPPVINDQRQESIPQPSSDKNVTSLLEGIPTESAESPSTCAAISINEQLTRHIVPEGPVVSKRKRKSRWEAVVPDMPTPPPPPPQQQDPSAITMTEPEPSTEQSTAGESQNDVMPTLQSAFAEGILVPPAEISTSSLLSQPPPLDQTNITGIPSAEEENSSPTKRVKIDPDGSNFGTAYKVQYDSTFNVIHVPISSAPCKTEEQPSGQPSGQLPVVTVNAAGDNQVMVKLEDANLEAIIKEEPGKEEIAKEEPGKEEPGKYEPGKEDPGEFTKPEPTAGEDSMEEGELETEVKEEVTEKPWDDSSGKEQGEIEDDGEEEGEKEDVKKERRKEEPRESREERRRRQYKEWGIVERSEMPRFGELTENYYLTERRRSKAGKEARRMVCCCTTSREERRRGEKACGEDCLNRVLMLECGSRCPCGDYCTNRRFQKREYARVGVFYAEGKGHGLKAKEELQANEFVMEYIGEVLNFHEFKSRAKQYSKDKNLHFYFMALKSDEIIDATEKGNVSRFMNHSCDPNCETQKWTVNGQLRVGFFTKRHVQPGEELTFDYQFEVYGQEAQKCLCGSEKCRGVIGKQKKQKDTTPKRRGSVGERRKKEAFTDITLEDEIQQMVDELDECGLQSNDHTIALSRFMVRADQLKQRLSLLKLLQETTDQSYLKYFLQHHGLRLLWSWMVDLGDNPAELQMQILRTLAQLPIPNKNALEDSKVLSVIERWAKDSAKQTPVVMKTDSDVDSSSASETPSRSDTPISAAMASSLNVNKSTEMLKSIAEATSSESDMDSEAPPGALLALRLGLEAESTESPTSTASDEGETNEKPTSSAGEVDSASDAPTSSSMVVDAELTISEGDSSNQTVPLESDVHSTEADSQATKDSPSQSREVRTLKSLAADASAKVQSQNSSTDIQPIPSTSQSVDIVDKPSEPSAECLTDNTSESENRTTGESENQTLNEEQPSSSAAEETSPKDTNNEAESKTEQERSAPSELSIIISGLLDSWSDLKEIYRIPKKESEKDRDKEREKDRDRDRHRDHDRDRSRYDRDRDYDRDRHRDRDYGRDRDRGRDRDDRRRRSRDSDRDRDRHKDRDRKDREKSDDKSRRKRSRSRSRERESKSSWSKDSEANATPPKLRKPWKETKPKEGKGITKDDVKIEETKKMSKEERRHLFEMQVEAKEREDAARKEQEALMMAEWQESEQHRQQQMAQYIDENGFPVNLNPQGMMVNEHGIPVNEHGMPVNEHGIPVNEHGMPIEVIPGHMGGMPMGEPYMGHPDMPHHPDMPFPPEHMHGQFPEHMQHQHHEHMGMEEGYHQPMHHEHHAMPPHMDGQPMYDDSGFPIPPGEHMPPGMMEMPHAHEGMPPPHHGMDYQMHPDMVDPNAMPHPHQDPMAMDPNMMGAHPHTNMDIHLLGGQPNPHPVDPNMYAAEQHPMQPQMEAVAPHVPQVVPIPAAQGGQEPVPTQPAPREEDLMPPPALPAPSRKSKKSKSQKAAKSAKTSPPSTTYVAPASSASSSASPAQVLPLPPCNPTSVNPQGYPAQAATPSVIPVAQAPQVMQTPVLPQAPQQAAQTTFTFVTPDGMLVTQTIVPLTATDQGMQQQHQQMAGIQQQQQQVSESIPSPPAKPKTAKLPPKWKTAQDSEGKTYYYHSVTRQTQWDMPTWDESDMYDEESGGGSSTPTYDEKSKAKTTTAPADTSSEAAKRLKEAFRSKMSHHVVGYLNAYRKPDCKSGRITNTEDFKHLARKLTHGIMAKELKHCRNIEDLEVNENVKHKAKEYIKKYMGRYGKRYEKDATEFDL